MQTRPDLELHRLLTQRFSLGDLQQLCLVLNIDYEDIPGSDKSGKVRELILYMTRRSRFDELVGAAKQLRPEADWTAFGGGNAPSAQPTASGPVAQSGPTVAVGPDATPQADDFSYQLESQPWFAGELPPLRHLGEQQKALAYAPLIDIVLLTVNQHEFRAVMHLLRPLAGEEHVLVAHVDAETYYLGQFGAAAVAVSRCEMGAHQPGSATIATRQAQQSWSPRAIIMVGIAFGAQRGKQRIGDVLVARDIIPYNPQRVGERHEYRGRPQPADQTLLNRFTNAFDWTFARPDGAPCRIHAGAILSGEELIDDLKRKQDLLGAFPQAIGGEMEGTGLSASAAYGRTPWILVKSICDWADGSKTDAYQPLAAAAAASLVLHVLVNRSAFESLAKPQASR